MKEKLKRGRKIVEIMKEGEGWEDKRLIKIVIVDRKENGYEDDVEIILNERKYKMIWRNEKLLR